MMVIASSVLAPMGLIRLIGSTHCVDIFRHDPDIRPRCAGVVDDLRKAEEGYGWNRQTQCDEEADDISGCFAHGSGDRGIADV